MDLSGKVYVAGHRGMVGSAICRQLSKAGFSRLITRTRAELDLCSQEAVQAFFASEKPEYVFLAAAKVGGIIANIEQPAEFIRDNLLIQTNVIDAAFRSGAKKLLFLGSSCVYPLSSEPMKEDFLLAGPLEVTNESYSIAKIAGIKMCQAYKRQYGFDAVSVMPCNIYGEGDNYDERTSHVIPALIRKMHEAARQGSDSVTILGSGAPLREFLYVDDLAEACLFVMDRYSGETHINIGSGSEISVMDLAGLVADVVGYTGGIVTDPSRPDGNPRKLMDSSRLFSLGWRPSTALREGIAKAYRVWRSMAAQ